MILYCIPPRSFLWLHSTRRNWIIQRDGRNRCRVKLQRKRLEPESFFKLPQHDSCLLTLDRISSLVGELDLFIFKCSPSSVRICSFCCFCCIIGSLNRFISSLYALLTDASWGLCKKKEITSYIHMAIWLMCIEKSIGSGRVPWMRLDFWVWDSCFSVLFLPA